MSGAARDIARMPRGGFDASCLDRRVQTRRLEYLDRDDVGPKKRQVIDALDTVGRVLGDHRRFAHAALREVANVTDPKILELGAGHGGLSRALLIDHPTAEVTVTDVEPASVAAMAAGELGRHRRATVQQMDATAIDAADGSFDLAVSALSLHHLPPAAASRVLAEATRVAETLLIIDLPRPPSPLHLMQLVAALPLTPLVPLIHDGFISSLRAYSPSALRALAAHADPAIEIEVRPSRLGVPLRPPPQIVTAHRGG